MSSNKTNDSNPNKNGNHNQQFKIDREQEISNYYCDGVGEEEESSSSSSLALSPVPCSINSNSSSNVTSKYEEREEESENVEKKDVFLTPCSSQVVDLDDSDDVIGLNEEICQKDDDEEIRTKPIGEPTKVKISKQKQSLTISPLMATDEDLSDNDGDINKDKDKQFSTTFSLKFNNDPDNSKAVTHDSCTSIPLGKDTNNFTRIKNNITCHDFFSIEKESFKTSLSSKASPFLLPSWIALSLTLDGRDKLTKVIQYTSRLLGYYYETLATATGAADTATTATNIYYSFKAKKFRNLYKAMASSRKAYRFGRTLIELEKLKSMGLIHWIAWYLRQSMFMDTTLNMKKNINDTTTTDNDSNTIDKDTGSAVRFHPNTTCQNEPNGEEVGANNSRSAIQKKSTKLPPRINLTRQISSNVGFRPSILHNDNDMNEVSNVQKRSYLGKLLYKSLSSVMNEEKYLQQTSTSPSLLPPPLWKILSSTLKLLGLAGFWAGDNIAYLYSIGFLVENDANKTKKRKNDAAIFAIRSYFLAAVAGLYLNSREWLRHRNGPMKQVLEDISKLKRKMKQNGISWDYPKCSINGHINGDTTTALKEHQHIQELEKLEAKLEQMKHKHFKVCLALLKVRYFFLSFFFLDKRLTSKVFW